MKVQLNLLCRILPRCAPHPLRVFCDMQSSTSMYFIKNSRGIALSSSKEGAEKEILKANKLHSVGSLRLRCAENGLEPLVLNSAEQLHALKVAIKQIGKYLQLLYSCYYYLCCCACCCCCCCFCYCLAIVLLLLWLLLLSLLLYLYLLCYFCMQNK